MSKDCAVRALQARTCGETRGSSKPCCLRDEGSDVRGGEQGEGVLIQKTPHPGTWRHFVATRAAERDARAIQLLKSRLVPRNSALVLSPMG